MDGRWSNGCATNRERVSSLIEVQILVVARETPFRSWGVQNINTRTTQIRNSAPKRESVFSGKRFKSWSFVTGYFALHCHFDIFILSQLNKLVFWVSTRMCIFWKGKLAPPQSFQKIHHNPCRDFPFLDSACSHILSGLNHRLAWNCSHITGLVMMYSSGAPGLFWSWCVGFEH